MTALQATATASYVAEKTRCPGLGQKKRASFLSSVPDVAGEAYMYIYIDVYICIYISPCCAENNLTVQAIDFVSEVSGVMLTG